MNGVDGGYAVDMDQLRAHASNVDALRDRFDAVRAASAHIAQDDAAYGLLCGWIAGMLQGRHGRQDELVAYVEENLSLVVARLRQTADDYETEDADNADAIGTVADRLGG